MQISYSKGYKYKTEEVYQGPTLVRPEVDIFTEFTDLRTNGDITIREGYAWDGPTGMPDFKSVIKPSLVHDAIYQLIGEGHLDYKHRDEADRTLQQLCAENGTPFPFTPWAIYMAVHKLGGKLAKKPDTILTAP